MTGPTTSRSGQILWIVVGVLLLVVLGIGFYLYFYPIGITYVLPQRIAAAQVDIGDPLLAIKSLDLAEATVELKEGKFAVNVSGSVITISVGPNVKIAVPKLKLEFSDTDSKEPSTRTISANLTEIELAAEGQVSVSYNHSPRVPIEKVTIKSAEGKTSGVTAQFLFAKVVASILADVIHAPLSNSEPDSSDVQSRTKTANVRTAILSFRPNSSIRLPKGYTLTLGTASSIHVADLAYFREPAEGLTGSADLDLTFEPPTGLNFQQIAMGSVAGRLQLGIDLSLQRRGVNAKLKKQPGHEDKCDLTSGEIKYIASTIGNIAASASGIGTIRNATIQFASLAYDSTKQQGRFGFTATLDTLAETTWSNNGWEGSATLVAKGVNLQCEDPGREAMKLTATAEQPLSIDHLSVENKGSKDVVRLAIEKTSITGSLDNLIVTETYVKDFKASGGTITYTSGGLTIDASFLANASLDWHDRPAGKTNASSAFAIIGKVKPLAISKVGVGSINFPELDIDLQSKEGNQPGIIINCRSKFSVQSDVVAFSGAEIAIHSLTLESDKNGKIVGNGAAELSVPKVELAKATNAALQKEFAVPDGSVGTIVGFDGSVSGCKVDARGLSASYSGADLQIKGDISAKGSLTTSRRIVITFPFDHTWTEVNHNDFTISARMNGSAKVTFPGAAELLQQKADIDIHLQPPEALDVHMSSVQFIADLLKALNSIFHFDSKILEKLPSKVSLPLLNENTTKPSSILRRIHNQKISLRDNGSKLVLDVELSVEF